MLSAGDEIFKNYFALEADYFHDVPKAYSVAEVVHGRLSRDLLVTGTWRSWAEPIRIAGGVGLVHRLEQRVCRLPEPE